MPLGHRPADDGTGDARTRERAVLSAAAAVVTTSAWARRRLLELYSLPADRVHVAEPGCRRRRPRHRDRGRRGAAVRRGGDLRQGPRRAARCAGGDRRTCRGSACASAAWTATRRSSSVCVAAHWTRGLGDRVSFPGPRTGADLDRSYAAADLMVLASRAETYGMVVTEALARGVPVLAAEVGGLPEALGHGADGIRPGLLVPPDDPAGTRRRAPGLARRRRAAEGGCAAPPASGASRCPGGRPPRRSSQVSWPGRRDERRGRSGSARNGLPCASLLTPRPVHAISSSTSGARSRRPAAG